MLFRSSSVAALAFSNDGLYLGIATSPGFEDGKEPEEMQGQVRVIIRELAPDEAKMKSRK